MIEEIQTLIEKYLVWLKDKTSLREVNGWVEVTTPFLDRHNDYLQIYAKKDDGNFILSDDGFILEDLKLSGCKLESSKRQALLKTTLNGFGVQLKENRLEMRTSPENFSLRKHNLLQAMLAINDLFYLAEPIVSSLFFEDVVAWLDLRDIRYTPHAKFTGKSGYDHLFDFVVPKSKKYPERLLQTITRPSRETAQVLAFSWVDTKEVRSSDSKAYAILNDTEHTVSSTVLDALTSYEVTPVLWSKREDAVEELAA
jgi:hypothetical protein